MRSSSRSAAGPRCPAAPSAWATRPGSAAGTTVFATSTRNFDHRLGDNTRVYLGSSELAALTALKGRIPTVEEYLAVMKEKVLPKADEIYRYLEFHKMGEFSLGYVR